MKTKINHKSCIYRMLLFLLMIYFPTTNLLGKMVQKEQQKVEVGASSQIDLISMDPQILGISLFALQNQMRLDSVYIDINFEYSTQKRKFLLEYDAENNFIIEKKYYIDSFQKPKAIAEKWYYSNEGLILRYEYIDQITLNKMTLIIPKDIREYSYSGSLLQQLDYKRYSGGSSDGNGNYTINYTNERHFYEYNQNDLLSRHFYTKKVTWLTDSTLVENVYSYNNELKLKLVEHIDNSDKYGYVTKYEYGNENDLEFEIRSRYSMPYEQDFNFDTLSVWILQERFAQGFYQNGLDSVYQYHYLHTYDPATNSQDFKIFYYYDDQLRLSEAHYFRWRKTLAGGEWYILGITNYSYDDADKLVLYTKSYFDANHHEWRIQETHTYFYSSTVATKVDQPKLKNEFRLFPNPASDHITIQTDNNSQAQYHIYDLFGRQMLSGNFQHNAIDVSGLARGTYLLRIIDGQSSNIKRFVKH